MNFPFKKTLALILCLLLVLSGCERTGSRPSTINSPSPSPVTTDISAPFERPAPAPLVHENIKFSKLPFYLPDNAELTAFAEAFVEDMANAASAEEQIALIIAFDRAKRQYSDMAAIAHINFRRNVSDETMADYEHFIQLITDTAEVFNETDKAIAESAYVDELERYFGEKALDIIRGYVRDFDPVIVGLAKEINDLENQYTQLMENQSGDRAAFAEKANALFDEMRVLRETAASLAGYDSYSESVFSDRPLSLAEVEAFIANIKQTILPVYQNLLDSAPHPYLACPAEGLIEFAFRAYGNGSEQRIYNYAMQVLRSTLDEMKPLIYYLERNELLDVMPREEKDDQLAATFNLYGYQIPFVIMPTPDIDTIIHEFGHALELYMMPKIDLSECFEQTPESAEISSTCMEVLTTLEFEQLFGETADYARMTKIYYMTSILLWAALQCEFELALYARPDLTMAERDALFAELLREYRMDHRLTDFQWQGIHHFFEEPLYVVSYPLAGVVALELWRIMEDDPDRAKEIYLDYLQDNEGQGFITRLDNAGFGNPAERENLEELARFLDELYRSEAFLSP